MLKHCQSFLNFVLKKYLKLNLISDNLSQRNLKISRENCKEQNITLTNFKQYLPAYHRQARLQCGQACLLAGRPTYQQARLQSACLPAGPPAMRAGRQAGSRKGLLCIRFSICNLILQKVL